jgi:GNAT superfamily N-acetyltransferase
MDVSGVQVRSMERMSFPQFSTCPEDVMAISSYTHQHPTDAGFARLSDALEGDRWVEALSDGTLVLIRPLHTDDRELETAFIRDLSVKSRRRRFLCDFKEPSEALIDQMMNLDYEKRTALIALIIDGGKPREIGVSRYCVTTDPTHCECAVTVADEWQKRGLGVLLMQRLIHEARKHGFSRMISVDAASNQAARALARRLKFERQLDPGDLSQVVHTLTL